MLQLASINPCKALSVELPLYSQALLHPSQGIKYLSVVAINIHPGSSISSQFWFSLLFVIRPRALCGVGLCILAKKTPWEGICGLGSWVWKEQLSIGASYLPLSDLTHALRCDRVSRQNAAFDMCALLPESLEMRSPAQQAERPVEATEYPPGRRSQQFGAAWSRGLWSTSIAWSQSF